MFDKVEAKARQLIAGTPKVTIAYYDPFDVATLKKSGHAGGDVVVSVTENGKPVADKDVYIFTNGANILKPVVLPYDDERFPKYSMDNVATSSDYMKVTTDSSGRATWNLIHSYLSIRNPAWLFGPWGCINYDDLGKALLHGQVFYSLNAVVFDQDPLAALDNNKMAGILCSASTPLEIKGVAAITDIKAAPYFTTPTEGATMVLEEGEAKVRVMNDKGSKGVYPADLPYYLMPGDKVLFARGNYAEITFFTGEKFHVEPGIWTGVNRLSDPETPFASVEIGKKDLGWYRWLSSGHFHVFELSISGAHTVVEGLKGGLGAAVEGVPVHVVFGLYFTFSMGEGQRMFDPLDVSAESVILFSPGNDSVNVSTFEGKAHLYDFTRNVTIDVPAGQQVIVSNDKSTGHNSFGPVTAFSENALNRGDLDLVNLAEGKASTTNATATPQQPSPKGSSPAPGIVAAAMAVLAVVFLMRKRRGE